jgi:hypothetical protein
MMKPPRYLGPLDRYDFLRELAVWAIDKGGKQFSRDLEHLAADVERYDRELRNLRRQVEDLDE